MMDHGLPNTLESSMCKVKAGDVVTRITQKGVELMGPLGYSRDLLFEKWMRDAKINDIFEGTDRSTAWSSRAASSATRAAS